METSVFLLVLTLCFFAGVSWLVRITNGKRRRRDQARRAFREYNRQRNKMVKQ